MIRWLQTDYGLDPEREPLARPGREYDLGNVFDPAYTMVCKMSKAILTVCRSNAGVLHEKTNAKSHQSLSLMSKPPVLVSLLASNVFSLEKKRETYQPFD